MTAEATTSFTGTYRPLAVEASRHADRYVVAVAGDLDASSVGRLDAEVRAAEATDVNRIVLDLSGLNFMDSTGLRALLQAQARSERDSNRLRIVRGPRRVQRVFELTNTQELLPFLD